MKKMKLFSFLTIVALFMLFLSSCNNSNMDNSSTTANGTPTSQSISSTKENTPTTQNSTSTSQNISSSTTSNTQVEPSSSSSTEQSTPTISTSQVEQTTTKTTSTSKEDVYFDVVFKDYENTILDTQRVKEGDTPSYTKSNPKREKDDDYYYVFNGWYPDLGVIHDNCTYIAQYEAEIIPTYEVTFVDYDDTVLDVQMVKEGDIPSYPYSNPTRESNSKNYKYTFDRWYPKLSGATKDITYKARYEYVPRSKYTISFVNYDDTLLDTVEVIEGELPNYSGTPTRNYDEEHRYIFDKWIPSFTEATEDTTYKATYLEYPLSSYIITFEDYDGTVLQTSQVKQGEIPTYNKSNPTRDNYGDYSYTFRGWDKVISKADSDITYVAQYTQHELPYAILFNLNGGTCPGGVPSIKIDSLDKNRFKFNVSKDKYKFKGWSYNGTQVFDDEGNIINNIQLTASMVFDAMYEESVTLTIQYTLYNPKTSELLLSTFTKPSDMGNISETRSYNWNTPVDLFANPSEGYTFVGWYYGDTVLSNEEDYNYMMWDENITIEARFKYTQYDIDVWSNNTSLGQVMIKNGSSQTWYNTQTQKQYYTESTTIAAYTKTGTRFLGWYDENNNLVSTSAVYKFTTPNRNYKLEAKWNYFTITYELDGGTNNSNNPTSYNRDMNNMPLYDATKAGYTFQGWKYKDNYIEIINSTNVCHMKIVAVWKVIDYQINYHLDNGTNDEENPNDYRITDDNIVLKNAIKEGYKFLCWVDENNNVVDTIETNRCSVVDLFALYEPKKYKANFYTDQGSLIIDGETKVLLHINYWKNSQYNEDLEVVPDTVLDLNSLIIPTRKDYEFDGWYLDDGYVEKACDEVMVCDDVNIYAKWMYTGSKYNFGGESFSFGTCTPSGKYVTTTSTASICIPESLLTCTFSIGIYRDWRIICSNIENGYESLRTISKPSVYIKDTTDNKTILSINSNFGSSNGDGVYSDTVTKENVEFIPGHNYEIRMTATSNIYRSPKNTNKFAYFYSIVRVSFFKCNKSLVESKVKCCKNKIAIEEEYNSKIIIPEISINKEHIWVDDDGQIITDEWKYIEDKNFYIRWINS